MAQPQQPQQFKPVVGIVKQVLSGDSIIIRDIPRGARPAEYTVNLAYLIAPKIAKKDTRDEPYAWEAREFLREKVIGKEVYLAVEYQIPASSRDCGILFLGKDQTGENVTESMVNEGLAEVRSSGQKQSEWQQKLRDLEAIAKAAVKGKWSTELPHLHVRDIKNVIENPTNFVDSLKKQPVKAIVEHVRDGSTVRVLLLPDFHNVLVLIAGIKCPSCGPSSMEEGGEEAKYFTESRLLQRQVEVTLLGVSNQNFIGTVQHPNGNIAEFLLSQGFAMCSDYSLKMIPEGREKLRASEKSARDKRLRIWKSYTPSGVTIEAKDKEFGGKVVEVVNADALVVKTPSGQLKKIFLSSVRPPRLEENKSAESQNDAKGRNFRPLYDIPFMYEAREFLRKKLIGKKVTVSVDYIQPASNSFPEKTCCTVTIGGINVAETLIGKGLAMVIRHKSSDVDQRSSHYDELMAGEMKAQKGAKGMHGKKDNAVHRVVDLSGDLSKSKAFFPFLERAGRMEAVVEFVASGSRLRLYIPKENKLITFLLGGISCPRATRPGPNATRIEGEPYGEEALAFTKELCLQREVDIQVEAMDKAGNFIGWLWVEGVNLSIALVGEGLASVHFTAERSPYASELRIKQDSAKSRKEKIWLNYVEPKADELIENEDSDRNVNYKKIVITEVKPDLNFYAQHEEDGARLEEMLMQMRQELTTNPPLSGAYTPRKGDLCAAKFSDGLWYRVRIEKVSGSTIHIFYIDFGNREETQSTKLAALPTLYHGVPYGAHEYAFACIHLPKDPEILEEARYVFHHDADNQVLKLNSEYKLSGVDYVTLVTEDGDDIVKGLIGEGLLLVERKRERRFQKFLKEYINSEEEARKKRLNLWQYGDVTEDEAKEFGM